MGWVVAIDAQHAYVGDLVGMSYLAELLTHPGRETAAAVLAGTAATPPRQVRRDLLDDPARTAEAARARDLAEDLAEAEANNDIGRAEQVQVEMDALVEQLAAAAGPDRRSSPPAHDPERVRTAVRKAVKRALDAVDAANPVIAEALRRTVRTGTTCVYTPEAHEPVMWTTGGPRADERDDSASSVDPLSSEATIGDRLRDERSRLFVGRTAELDLVRAALSDPDPSFSVVYVHGSGGVGKTALLDQMAAAATAAGRLVISLDFHTVEPVPSSVMAALAAGIGVTDVDEMPKVLGTLENLMLVVDTFELGDPHHEWLAHELIAKLPRRALVAIAGRNPPPPRWQADPAWRALSRVAALGNLSTTEIGRYLELHGVDVRLHGRVSTLTRGHPLALSLVVDVLQQRSTGEGDVADFMDAPDVVRTLMERFVGEIPDPKHREALAVCAHVRFTTEDLLRSVMGAGDAAGLFEWLRSRSFVEEGRHGLFPHDLARDVLDTDLRWRDRVRYQDLHARIRRYLLHRLRAPQESERRRAAVDLISLHRLSPVMHPLFDWTHLGNLELDQLRDDDAVIVEMTRHHQGSEQAELVGHWLDRQPQAFVVFRREGEVVGYVTILRLHEASSKDIARDPGARAMWEYANTRDPPGPGDVVTAARFTVDRAHDQRRPSASSDGWTMVHVLRIANTPGMTWDFIGPWQSGDIEPLMHYAQYHRVPEAEFDIGGRHHFVYANDWRRLAWDDFVEGIGASKLHEHPAPTHRA